jgi:hypothetical protein
MDNGSNHRRLGAATGPDGDPIDLNLDTLEIRLGLASLHLALWAHGCWRVYHCRYKLRLVNLRCPQLAGLPSPREHLLGC